MLPVKLIVLNIAFKSSD